LEPDGWVWIGRVHRPGGHGVIDHLLIGPGGIVVVDSLAWVGRIEVTRGVVQQNGFWREPECAEVARTAGAVAALLLPQHRTAVHAVICVAQHDLAAHHVAPGVHVVGVTGLGRVLRALPPRLHPAEILQLHTQLRHTLTDAGPPEQLTTAEFDQATGTVVPGCVLDVELAGPPEALFPPVARRSFRVVTRSAARRRRPARPRGRLDWRLLGVRLLLAALVATAAVVFGPGLLHHPVQSVPAQHIGPLVPQTSPSELPTSGHGQGVARPVDAPPSYPAASTAREDHHRPPI
jgi:hypothetical protein